MTTYLTSDTHFGHANISFYTPARAELWATDDIKEIAREYAKTKDNNALKAALQGRNVSLQESIQRMNEGLIKNWNEHISDTDDVYHCGDFMMGQSIYWESILNRLNGRIHLIRGNHDEKFVKKDFVKDRMIWIKDYYELNVSDPEPLRGGKKQKIVLSHFAFKVWNKSHHGVWSCSGHSHGSLDKWHREQLSLDVGVDSEHTNYYPISYEELKKVMSKKDVKFVDHHTSETRQ